MTILRAAKTQASRYGPPDFRPVRRDPHPRSDGHRCQDRILHPSRGGTARREPLGALLVAGGPPGRARTLPAMDPHEADDGSPPQFLSPAAALAAIQRTARDGGAEFTADAANSWSKTSARFVCSNRTAPSPSGQDQRSNPSNSRSSVTGCGTTSPDGRPHRS